MRSNTSLGRAEMSPPYWHHNTSEDRMKSTLLTLGTLAVIAMAAGTAAADEKKKTCEGRAPACATCKDGSWDHSACKPDKVEEPKKDKKK